MRNKYKYIIILLICFCARENKVLAGDFFSSMAYNYSPQDSLIIGEISNITDESVEIKVVRVVVGKICKANILLHRVEGEEIEIGDGILLSANFLDDELYECNVAHGYYKVKIGSDTKVEVLLESKDTADEYLSVQLQWYANTGRILNKKGSNFFDAKLLGKDERVYNAKEHKWLENSFEKKYFAPNKRIERNLKVLLFTIGVVGVIYCIRRRIFKRHGRKEKI